MDNTTSIMDLPTYQSQPINEGTSSNNTIDENQIRQIVSGIQDASLHGATRLNSVDFPKDSADLITDMSVTPNYIPPVKPGINQEYITENVDLPTILSNQQSNQQNKQLFDNIYDEIQMPLIVSVLFFMYQLPFFKKYLHNNFKILHYADGSMNLIGNVTLSILFGILYYIINLIIFRYT
jgi:hypothetical protein